MSLLDRLKLKQQINLPFKLSIDKPSKDEVYEIDTDIVEEETDIDFSKFREILANRGLEKPKLLELSLENKEDDVMEDSGVIESKEDDMGDSGVIESKGDDVKLYTIKEDEDKGVEKVEKVEKSSKEKKFKNKFSKRMESGTITATIADKLDDSKVLLKVPASMVKINGEAIKERIEPKEVFIPSSTYHLNNRETFSNFINNLFSKFKIKDEKNLSCKELDKVKGGKFKLLTHQKLVKEYLNLYTPYRGLLLYFGLGAGKTCASIAIAEGIKSENRVIVMTPASLRPNFISELKKCGDPIYKTNQYWEFINTEGNKEQELALSKILSIPLSIIEKHGGAWLVNIKKESNYDKLKEGERISLDKQIEIMILNKYKFINYNGIRMNNLKDLEDESIHYSGRSNPFDNKVVIIDEVHNFVSRIVNKLGSKNKTLSVKLYEYLMDAENCRLVFLTGTPIINYPNEIAILFNMLRGYIKTYHFNLRIRKRGDINLEYFKKLFIKNKIYDYIEYNASSTKLIITRNPHSFVNRYYRGSYKGVYKRKGMSKNIMSENTFKRQIIKMLNDNDIDVIHNNLNDIKIVLNKALPDNSDEFIRMFINKDYTIKNEYLFKRRILGLTSYYRSAAESLLPKFDTDTHINVEKIDMSDYQLGLYINARTSEFKEAKRNIRKKQKDIYAETSSSYRIFSRAYCNFVFPTNIVERPMPRATGIMGDIDENDIDNKDVKERINDGDGTYTLDDDIDISKQISENIDNDYSSRIKSAINKLKENSDDVFSMNKLKTYSPKFLSILKKLKNEDIIGTHLIYSQFRSIEGIGILKEILEYHGFIEFKIKQQSGQWRLDINPNDIGKPTYALYTGTEDKEVKEIVRNIFNSNWDNLSSGLINDLSAIHENNHYGEIIKSIMITASGAEGITLKNVRHVHIVEPYWHPVRAEQVIGRAVRICSHDKLIEKHREVQVYVYLMTFTDKQLNGDPNGKTKEEKMSKINNQIKTKDLSRIDNKTVVTSDETLYEISRLKEEINKNILRCVKETSIDCSIHMKSDSKEKIACYIINSMKGDRYTFKPSYEKDDTDKVDKLNKKTIQWRGVEYTLQGKKYILKQDSQGSKYGELYDIDSYYLALNPDNKVKPRLVSKIMPNPKNPNELIVTSI